jgi:putative ABC transport system substrate-binding protein
MRQTRNLLYGYPYRGFESLSLRHLSLVRLCHKERMTDRRTVLIALGLVALAAPGRAVAQQQKVWRVGLLIHAARPASLDGGSYGAFLQEMSKRGYVEGRNVTYEWRFTSGRTEGVTGQANDLARLNMDVIVTSGTPPTRAAQKATTTIPIVMVNTGDPVGSGLVASLSRPGGNITGLTNINVDVNAKRVDLLTMTLPKLSRVGAMLNPGNPTYAANLSALQGAARKAGLTLSSADARTPDEIEAAISRIRQNADALIVQTDGLFSTQARRIAELAAKARLPTIGPPEIAVAGGLISYGPNYVWVYRRAAAYVDSILKGAKPAELSVEQPTKLELVINLKTAKALDVAVPRELMLLADQVIQ